jgi:glycogenin glucosyltransferase
MPAQRRHGPPGRGLGRASACSTIGRTLLAPYQSKADNCLEPSPPTPDAQSKTPTKCSYVTLLTSDDHLKGVLLLSESLKRVGADHELVALATDNVSEDALRVLSVFGIEPRICPEISMPEQARANNEATGFACYDTHLSKLHVFELLDFAKLVYIDADMLLLKNVDHLFSYPHLSAIADAKSAPGWSHLVGLNSGLMVIEPRAGLLNQMLEYLPQVVESKPSVGDQAVINHFYDGWPYMSDLHIDAGYNLYESTFDHYVRHEGYGVFGKTKRIVAVHFIGERKPWMRTPFRWVRHLLALVVRRRFHELYVNVVYCTLLMKIALRLRTT